MRKWVVTLPGHRNCTLESDTPSEDLAALGYSAFGLMELDGPAMKRWWKYPAVPGQRGSKAAKPAGSAAQGGVPW